MDRERWDYVDKLLQSALDRLVAERDVFVRRACGGDEQLEHDVRTRLAAHDRADCFLGAPALDLAALSTSRKAKRPPAGNRRSPRGGSILVPK